MKKRLLIAVLVLSLVLALASCGLKDVVGSDSDKKDESEDSLVDLDLNIPDIDDEDLPTISGDSDTDDNSDSNSGLDPITPDGNDSNEFGDSTINYTYPYGWTEELVGDYGAVYYNPNYPSDGSNINLIITQPDTTLKNYSQAEFEEVFLESLQSTDLAGVDISVDYFDHDYIDGYDTVFFEVSYDYMGVSMIQSQCYIVVPNDCTYILTFTQAGGNDWSAEFNEMLNSIYIS